MPNWTWGVYLYSIGSRFTSPVIPQRLPNWVISIPTQSVSFINCDLLGWQGTLSFVFTIAIYWLSLNEVTFFMSYLWRNCFRRFFFLPKEEPVISVPKNYTMFFLILWVSVAADWQKTSKITNIISNLWIEKKEKQLLYTFLYISI